MHYIYIYQVIDKQDYGKCVCKHAFYGNECEHECQKAGLNNDVCGGNGICDMSNGKCTCFSDLFR